MSGKDLVASGCHKVLGKPSRGDAGNFVQGPRFLEKVRRAWDNDQLLFAAFELGERGLIHGNHRLRHFRRRSARLERPRREERLLQDPAGLREKPPPHNAGESRGRHQRRAGSGARAEIADREVL